MKILFIVLLVGLGLFILIPHKPQPVLPVFPDQNINYDNHPEVLERIMLCESGGDRFAKNPVSSALGIFQIIDSTELFCERHLGIDIDRTSINDSWLCAIFLYERYGTAHWICK